MSGMNSGEGKNKMEDYIGDNNLLSLIEQTIDNISALGMEFTTEREKISELKSRLVDERFHLAVLGQFKRGKSTLINALLGEKTLPSAVIPLTAIPTLIRAGSDRGAKVSFANKRVDEMLQAETSEELSRLLARFVTETENPKNCLGVSKVEVFHPSSFLTNGVVLIDTPGIGSTFRHNTEVTLNFLPQCDAAIFVSSADPPITEVEVAFLKEVQNKVGHLIFVLNKLDYLNEKEKDDALKFFQIALRDAGFNKELPIFCISARLGLEARQNDDTAKWVQSGLSQLESHLIDFFISKKAIILNQALTKKSADVISEIRMKLQIMIQSLRMPLADLDERRQALIQKIDDIERQRMIAEDLLEGDRRRTLEHLEKQAEDLRQKVRKHLNGILLEYGTASLESMLDQKVIEQAIAEEIPGLFERELGHMSRAFDHYVGEVFQLHQQRAKNLIDEIRQSAADLFAIPHYAVEAEGYFKMKRKPYWVAHNWTSSFSAIPQSWLDKLLPITIRRARIVKKLEEQIEFLVNRNVENLRWETLQNLNDTFRQFIANLREQLHLTLAATHGAIEAVWEKRQSQTGTVECEIKKLESALAQFTEIEKGMINNR